jgi:lysophospholipase L1-like esterase
MARKLNTQASIIEKLHQEGESLASVVNISIADATGITTTGAGYDLGYVGALSVVKAAYIKSICITSNKDCYFNVLQIAPTTISGAGTPSVINMRVVVNAGVPAIIPMDIILPRSTGGIINFYIKEIYSTTKTNCYFGISASGYQFTDDLNFGADKVVLHIGDSITNGTGITTSKTNFYPWRVRQYFRGTAGQNCRLVNMSVSGSNSVAVETWRQMGKYDLEQIDCIFYSMGINDAVAGTSAATFQNNLQAFIGWKQKHYPNAKLIFLGATPAENNTTEAAMATLRNTMQGVVTAAADSRVLYYSMANAFDRTQGTTVYVSSDTAGSRLHPNEATHAIIGNAVVNYLSANNVTL